MSANSKIPNTEVSNPNPSVPEVQDIEQSEQEINLKHLDYLPEEWQPKAIADILIKSSTPEEISPNLPTEISISKGYKLSNEINIIAYGQGQLKFMLSIDDENKTVIMSSLITAPELLNETISKEFSLYLERDFERFYATSQLIGEIKDDSNKELVARMNRPGFHCMVPEVEGRSVEENTINMFMVANSHKEAIDNEKVTKYLQKYKELDEQKRILMLFSYGFWKNGYLLGALDNALEEKGDEENIIREYRFTEEMSDEKIDFFERLTTFVDSKPNCLFKEWHPGKEKLQAQIVEAIISNNKEHSLLQSFKKINEYFSSESITHLMEMMTPEQVEEFFSALPKETENENEKIILRIMTKETPMSETEYKESVMIIREILEKKDVFDEETDYDKLLIPWESYSKSDGLKKNLLASMFRALVSTEYVQIYLNSDLPRIMSHMINHDHTSYLTGTKTDHYALLYYFFNCGRNAWVMLEMINEFVTNRFAIMNLGEWATVFEELDTYDGMPMEWWLPMVRGREGKLTIER